jgi:hypothetical protein
MGRCHGRGPDGADELIRVAAGDAPRAGAPADPRGPGGGGGRGGAGVVADGVALGAAAGRPPARDLLALCEHPRRCRLRGGRGVRPLPCGDRRVLPPAPHGPLALADLGDGDPGDRRGGRRPAVVRGGWTGVLDRAARRAGLPPRDAPGRVGPGRRPQRGRGPVCPRLGELRSEFPGRPRRLSVPIADQLVRAPAAVGPVPGLPAGQRPFRPAGHLHLPVLPREPCRAGGGGDQPLPAADLPRPRDRLRAVPRARRAARAAAGRPRRRRPGPDDRRPGGAGAGPPRRRLRAMPPDRGGARPEAGPARGGLPARAAALRHLVGIRAVRGDRHGEVRGPGGADAREPVLPREFGPTRLHLLPRPASPAGARGAGRLLPRAVPGVPRRRAGLPAARAGAPRAESRR